MHCVGMCGGIVCSYSVPVSQVHPKFLWKFHATYVLGRFVIYSWIGALMGAVGMGIGTALGPYESLQHMAAWFAAIVMLVGGAASAFGQKWPDRIGYWISTSFRFMTPSLQRWSSRFGPWKAFPLGMLSGILPCGLMWAVELRAMATNSLFWGMATMFTFCLITTPALLLTGTVMTKISPHFRYRSVQFAGIVVMAMGGFLLMKNYNSLESLVISICLPS